MASSKKIIRAVTVAKSIGFYETLIPELKNSGYEVLSLSSDGPELLRLSDIGVKTIIVPMERRISPLKDIKSLLKIIKVLRNERPYLVHSMTPKAGLLCMVAAWLTKVPRRIHTFTGLVWPTSTGIKRRILMITDWITCACATHIIPEGQGVLNDLKSHITTKPMKVLGYGNVRGVDVEKFSRRPEVLQRSLNIKKDGVFTFIFVGRIVRDKGIDELVNAFLEINKAYPTTRLLLVGCYEEHIDPLATETINLINENPFIEAVGQKKTDDLLAYYAASDCFVLPSYREGFPNVVLEAGAMELPSIVTDINGSREIIKDGYNGLVVPSKDKQSLYSAMERMITYKEQTYMMASNARPLIVERFEQSYVRQCLLDFYNEILSI